MTFPNLDSIERLWYRYRVQSNGLSLYKTETLNAILNGSEIQPPFEAGTTYDEAKRLFSELREDLDRFVIFDLISATEAAIRLDYLYRCQNRDKDPLSRAYRMAWKKHREKTTWKELRSLWVQHCPDARTIVNQFFELLPIRHWIAHGRYYQLRARIQMPQEVMERVDAMMQAGVLRARE